MHRFDKTGNRRRSQPQPNIPATVTDHIHKQVLALDQFTVHIPRPHEVHGAVLLKYNAQVTDHLLEQLQVNSTHYHQLQYALLLVVERDSPATNCFLPVFHEALDSLSQNIANLISVLRSSTQLLTASVQKFEGFSSLNLDLSSELEYEGCGERAKSKMIISELEMSTFHSLSDLLKLDVGGSLFFPKPNPKKRTRRQSEDVSSVSTVWNGTGTHAWKRQK
jgi:hypothetical protein